jgi:hypothetical protein
MPLSPEEPPVRTEQTVQALPVQEPHGEVRACCCHWVLHASTAEPVLPAVSVVLIKSTSKKHRLKYAKTDT